MKKKLLPPDKPGMIRLMFTLLFIGLLSVANAQTTVTGTVTDEDRKPVSGATVTVKGTVTSAATDAAGKFSINAPGTGTLVISYVGFTTQEISLNGRSSLSVSLSRGEATALTEVVVTTLGIKKESRKLGYAAENVKMGEMQQNRTNNMMASLEGKIAGLDISPPTAGAASSTKIRLRGQMGFAGSTNSPLIVLNGLPIDQGADGANGETRRDNGDNLLLFNPDDIESMTVLKGATAAALYGVRASNGAIIITTKSGARNTGVGVELTSSFASDELLDFTDFQYEYGQGQGKTVNGVVVGSRPISTGEAQGNGQLGWGEKYDGVPTPQFDGVSRPYTPQKNRLKEFYNTGQAFTNTIAVSGGNTKANFRASFSNMDAKGISPGNEYHRRIFNLAANQNLGDKITVQVNLNYTFERNLNNPQVGVQGQNYYNFITRTSPVVPLSAYREGAFLPDGSERPSNGFATSGTVLNPYFYIPNQYYRDKGDRLLGTITARYQMLKWLYVQGRANMDLNTSFNEQNQPTGALSIAAANRFQNIYYESALKTYNGSYAVSQGYGRQMNYDFLLGGNHQFGDFTVDASFGGNIYTTYGRSTNANSTAFVERGIYSIGNCTVFGQGYGFSESRNNSLYGYAEFGYKNFLFINVTGRNDWFSVLNPNNNNFFYPSVSGSFVFSELVKFSWLDYGKLRGSFAKVGGINGINPYYGTLNYTFNTNQYLDYTIANIGTTDSPNPNLTPFSVTEKEIGLTLKMFKTRVNVDIAAYDKKTEDQILSSQISSASGYNTTVQNTGSLRNQGIELVVDWDVIRTRDFTWNTALNTSYNTSKVLSLSPGVNRFVVVDWYNGGGSNEFMGKLVYEVGKPLNQIAAKTYLRNDKGEIVVKTDGRLKESTTDVLFGSSLPKYIGGWNNNIRFKKLSLLVHFDYKAGGKILSGSALNSLRQGHSKASLVGRNPGENGVVFPGVYLDGPNVGKPNTTASFGQTFYADYRSLQIADPFVYKSDFLKLRNITISYDLTSLIGSRLKVVKGLTLSASCRNVATLKKYTPDIDPEALASTGDFRAGYEAVSLPTTRTWGVNLNVKF